MIWSWGGGIRRWRRKRRGEGEREEEEEKQQSREVYGGGGGGLVTKSSDSCDPMDCNLPGSSVHGILQARILEWVAISFSRERYISSVQSLNRVLLFATPWTAARQASLSITNSRSSPWLTSIESVMPSSHLILSSPSPPAPNPSQHQSLFQRVNSSHEVAKGLEFQL